MYIIAYDNSNTILSEANNSAINSKEIICPQCSENCRICFKNFKISLYQCKNKHRIDNIPLNLFKNTQKIKESEIVCNNCNKINKSISYNHQFFKCFTCNKNLCPICSSTHIKSHAIIDYNKKNYFCNIHNDSFISYCSKCQINLCLSCESKHKEHKIISFSDIFPNIDDIKTEMNKFKNMIDIFKNDINKIIKILTEIISAFDNYYKINYDIINNFQIQNRNYEILQNINEIKNNIKINNKIKEINNINNIINKFKAIIILYNEINKKELKVNDNKNESNEINNKESKDKNNITEHKPFDPSIYVKYGLTVEEILDYKETFDLFDYDKKGLINAEELLEAVDSLKNDLKNNNTYHGLIENLKKKRI